MTHTDAFYTREEARLLKMLKKNTDNKGKTLVKIGWLYDQWALLHSNKRGKTLRGYAEIYFMQALRQVPPYTHALNGLGTVYLHENRYGKSLECYRRLHHLHQSFTSYNALGNIYRALGKNSLSRKNYATAMRLAESAFERNAVKYNLSQLRKVKGDGGH